jgi:hypothetical protein
MKIMEIYVLSDENGIILGAFSSIENVNKVIEGKTFGNKKFLGDWVFNSDILVGLDRSSFFHVYKTTLDKEEI